MRREAERLRQFFKPGAFRAVADNQQARVRHDLDHLLTGAKQHGMIFNGIEPRHDAENGIVCRQSQFTAFRKPIRRLGKTSQINAVIHDANSPGGEIFIRDQALFRAGGNGDNLLREETEDRIADNALEFAHIRVKTPMFREHDFRAERRERGFRMQRRHQAVKIRRVLMRVNHIDSFLDNNVAQFRQQRPIKAGTAIQDIHRNARLAQLFAEDAEFIEAAHDRRHFVPVDALRDFIHKFFRAADNEA